MKISNSEHVILEILWTNPPLTAAQIVELAQQEQPWSDKTIKTFLNRLREKGAVRAQKREVLYYSPTVAPGEPDLSAAKALIDQRFGGSLTTLVSGFIQNGAISEQDIQQLRQYLDHLEESEGR